MDKSSIEEKLSEIYDKLVEQGLDRDLIGNIFEKMSSNKGPIEEEAVLFESQFAQFEMRPDTNTRRSGLKKVDEEHLINLAKRTA